MSGDMNSLLEEGDAREGEPIELIDQQVESMFLTMSWWILHVGWKDVGERVRRGVEEVFVGVSLKSNLAAIDLHRLVSDVRRRVEHEVTFEGNDRRINFLSSLLPPTPETVQHVLTQTGFSQAPATHSQDLLDHFEDTSAASSSQLSPSQSHHLPPSLVGFPDFGSPYPSPSLPRTDSAPSSFHLHPRTQQPTPFSVLLDETRSIICSSDFAVVLEACLDRATEILFTNLEKSLFLGSAPPVSPGEAVRIRLAGLLPGLARWSVLAMNGNPNELVDNLLALRDVQCLSAIVFARYEEKYW